MVSVYQLHKDNRRIEAVQKATLSTWKFGIMPIHGLFGSAKWWQNVDSGNLKVHTLRGVITRLGMGGMRDTPEFRMRSDEGEDSNWLRNANSEDLDRFYMVGCRIEIDYALQRQRLFSTGGYWPKLFRVVIEIRLGEQKPIPALKQYNAFCYQAAKGSWATSIVICLLLMFSVVAARLILELIAVLLMLTGIGLGVLALFGISKHGKKGILAPAVVGIVLNGVLLFIFIKNYFAARSMYGK